MRKIFGLVLAGGQSRRMGQDKALIEHDGESQLARTARILGQQVDDVYVSARSSQINDAERARFPLIVDRFADMGPVAGILSAMLEHPDVDWLIVACDMPGIDTPTIANLLANRECTQPIVAYRSSYDGLPEPLCAIYKPESRNIIEQFVAGGIHCPRKMLIEADTLLLDPLNPHSLDNLNTPTELQEFRTGQRRT